MRKTLSFCAFILITATVAACAPAPAPAPGGTTEVSSSLSSAATSDASSSPSVSSAQAGSVTFEITSPAHVMDESTADAPYQFSGERLEVTGKASLNITKIVVQYYDKSETLTDFKSGDATWRYVLDSKYGNLRSGYQNISFSAYTAGNEVPYIRQLVLNVQFLLSPVKNPGGKLAVDWIAPTKVDTIAFLKETRTYDRVKTTLVNDPSWSPPPHKAPTDAEIKNGYPLYKVGTVTSEPYAGGTLFLMESACLGAEGPCFNSHYRFIEQKDHSLVLLKTASDDLNDGDRTIFNFAFDPTATLDLLPPQTLSIPNSSYTISLKYPTFAFFKDLEKDFAFHSTEINRDVFFDKGLGCLVIMNSDGTYSAYKIDFAMLPSGSSEGSSYRPFASDSTSGKLDMTWKDGSKNAAFYTHAIFTCDKNKPCYAVAKVQNTMIYEELGGNQSGPDKTGHPLEVIGKTAKGDDVYREVYTDKELQSLSTDCKGTPTRYLQTIYCQLYTDGPKPTIADLYKNHAVIYIKDPFGRYLRFTNEQFIPAVECGKPVIYLYPTRDMNVSVQVEPTGGFSVTEPAYGNGWFVRATSESRLTNISDGKIYGSLFWEGKGLNYRQPKEGFVVAKENVEATLREKLALLGLNPKETQEFLDFWLPRMQAKPYYLITFVPQEQFDVLAPLTVQPKPDTVIRVFMDYQELDAPIAVHEPVIKTPMRRGFSVVEWGGAIHR